MHQQQQQQQPPQPSASAHASPLHHPFQLHYNSNGNATSTVVSSSSGANALSDDAATVVETDNEQADDPVLRDLQSVYDDLADHRKHVTQLMSRLRRCYSKVEKRLTDVQQKKPVKKSGSGLTKPFPVSTSLCTFMDVPQGTQLARAEVTKYLHKYIRDKNLYDESNKQYIIPDTSLKTLLNIPNDERLHIFSMQQKMNSHFEYVKKTHGGESGGSGSSSA